MIPRHGLGTAPLGGLFAEVSDVDAAAALHTAIEGGMRYFDTAPLYGHGLAETRLGTAIRASGVNRGEFSISTKVGRVLVPGVDPVTAFRGVPPVRPAFDFSADGVRASLEASMVRLGVDHVELVLVHDPDDHEEQALRSALPTLVALRDEGTIGAIGVGMNQVEMLTRFARRATDIGLDYVLVGGRWTLLDRSAGRDGGLLDTCLEQGVSVIVGGVFNSGLLADPREGAMFDYTPAHPALVRSAIQMASRCHDVGVSLNATALQFPWRHRAVSSVVVGARSGAEVTANSISASEAIPDSLWDALDECREPAP